MELNGRNVFFWPAPLRRAVDSIAVMLMQACVLARGRAAASPSPVVRNLAGRDEEAWKLTIWECEIGVLGRWGEALPSKVFRNPPRWMPQGSEDHPGMFPIYLPVVQETPRVLVRVYFALR